MPIWYPSSSISMDRKDYYNEKFILHVYWNSNEIIAILGNFLKYKMRHILLEYFNSVSANYKPFIPEECKIAKYIPTYLVDCQIHRITHHWHQLKFCWETCFLLLFIFGTPKWALGISISRWSRWNRTVIQGTG